MPIPFPVQMQLDREPLVQPMTERVLVADGKASIMLLGPALIRLTWLPGSEIQEADARDVLEQSLILVERAPYAILVDVRQIAHISVRAREAYGSEKMVLAAAMLGETPVDRVLAASVQQSVHKVQFFTEESEALAWLSSHLPVRERPVLARSVNSPRN